MSACNLARRSRGGLALHHLRIVPRCFVHRSRKRDLGPTIHASCYSGKSLDCIRRRPEGYHHLVGDTAEHQQTVAARVLSDKCVPHYQASRHASFSTPTPIPTPSPLVAGWTPRGIGCSAVRRLYSPNLVSTHSLHSSRIS